MTPHLAGTPVLDTPHLTSRAPEGPDWKGRAALAVSERSRFIGGPLSRADAFRTRGHAIGQWVIRGYGTFVCVLKDTGRAIALAERLGACRDDSAALPGTTDRPTRVYRHPAPGKAR